MTARKPTVGDYMTAHPHTIGLAQTLETAHELMRRHQLRHLPVLEGGKVLGIVSLRDLHLVETLPDVDPKKLSVEEAMSPEPYVTTPATPLVEVARELGAHKYGAAIVMEGGRVVGVFTLVDALRALVDALERS